MAFQDRAQGICSHLHLTAVRRPLFIGVAILLGLVLAAALLFALPSGSNAFEVQSGSGASAGVDGAASLVAEDGSGPSGDAGVADAAREPPASVSLPTPSPAEAPPLCIHVDGAVEAPGVYYLDAGSRIVDAVEAAGGLKEGAATEAVNLAQVLEDGQQVLIPTPGDAAALPPAPASAGARAAGADAGRAVLVNINTATAEELVTLNGIGEATAEKIIADREANGPFPAIEDLKRVSGIGDKKFEALRDAICV